MFSLRKSIKSMFSFHMYTTPEKINEGHTERGGGGGGLRHGSRTETNE